MGSDTRMNKCFVRNTVPNRAGSRKKTRRAHVPRGQPCNDDLPAAVLQGGGGGGGGGGRRRPRVI